MFSLIFMASVVTTIIELKASKLINMVFKPFLHVTTIIELKVGFNT